MTGLVVHYLCSLQVSQMGGFYLQRVALSQMSKYFYHLHVVYRYLIKCDIFSCGDTGFELKVLQVKL